jgi:nicotinamide-nucleotide amidase
VVAELRAGIVATGSELVAGRIADANGPWLAQRLGELGVEVPYLLSVSDRRDELAAALTFLADAPVGLIVVSGGLGPTADDLTAEVVAAFAGAELVLDEAMESTIAEILASYAARMDLSAEALRVANRKQAMVPRGALALQPVGTAPGLVVRRAGGPLVVVLPGPPRELQAMWPAALAAPEMASLLAGVRPFGAVSLRFFSLPESEITATLTELGERLDLSPLEITTCQRRSELEVDIRFRPGAEAVSEALVDGVIDRHRKQLVSTDGTTTDEQVAALLTGRRIGLGESCTGGLVTARLTDRPGSSDYVAGGVVAYSNDAKVSLLGVPAELIERHGAVSPEVARAMADGARKRFDADIGCSVTGVAGPGGGTPDKPVGYVCFCVTTADGGVLAREVHLRGSRAEVRERSVDVAMHLIRRAASRTTPS